MRTAPRDQRRGAVKTVAPAEEQATIAGLALEQAGTVTRVRLLPVESANSARSRVASATTALQRFPVVRRVQQEPSAAGPLQSNV